MRFSKAIFVLVSGLSVAGIASAQDQAAVSAEKQSGIKTLLPGAYANVELRHSTLRTVDEDNKVVNDVPAMQARPTVGSTFFNDKVDTAFTWVFKKSADTNFISKSYLLNITQIKAVEGKYGNIGPYFETYQSNGQSFNESDIGLYGELTNSFDLSAGKLALTAYTEPVGVFMDKHTASGDGNKIAPRNETSQEKLSLNEAGDDTIQQRDPTIANYYGVNAKFSPEALKGFSVKGAVDLLSQWKPKYATKETEDGETRTELTGYETRGFTMNRIILGYKISDTLSIANQFRQYIGGIYGTSIDSTHPDQSVAGVGTNRFENRLQLTATLF